MLYLLWYPIGLVGVGIGLSVVAEIAFRLHRKAYWKKREKKAAKK